MNRSSPDIEALLRAAPSPAAPVDLRTTLVNNISLRRSPASIRDQLQGGWFRRWWPALSAAAVCLACAVVLAIERAEISDLKQTLASLSTPATQPGTTAPIITPQPEHSVPGRITESEQEEIQRLKQIISQLKSEISQLETLHTENDQLRKQIVAPALTGLTSEEADAVSAAREKAMAIQCVNNLKQFGLAVRIWSTDHGDIFPPDVAAMSMELHTPKVVICPADPSRQAATNWESFSAANCSYEYLAPSGADKEPTRVLSRCPIHGNVGLCDGSVQMSVAKTHPEYFLQRDGKLFFERNAQPQNQETLPK
jgi:hypothetical protein